MMEYDLVHTGNYLQFIAGTFSWGNADTFLCISCYPIKNLDKLGNVINLNGRP